MADLRKLHYKGLIRSFPLTDMVLTWQNNTPIWGHAYLLAQFHFQYLTEKLIKSLIPWFDQNKLGLDIFRMRSVSRNLHMNRWISSCLFVLPSVCPYVCPSVCQSICRSIRQSVCPSVCPSVSPFVRPFVRPSVRLSVHQSVRQSVHLLVDPFGRQPL